MSALPEMGGLPDMGQPQLGGLPSMALPPPGGFAGGDFGGAEAFEEDPVARLKNLIEERQDETVEVLRTWIETPEETA